jgi:hypothetical protein
LYKISRRIILHVDPSRKNIKFNQAEIEGWVQNSSRREVVELGGDIQVAVASCTDLVIEVFVNHLEEEKMPETVPYLFGYRWD